MLESLGAAPMATEQIASSRAPAALLYARTCYDHLAGELAVRIYASMIAAGHLLEHQDHLELTDAGADHLGSFGVDVPAARSARRPTARTCLDWTERRHHLAGSIATGMLDTFLDRHWVARSATPRAIRVTELGRTAIFQHFALGDARVSA